MPEDSSNVSKLKNEATVQAVYIQALIRKALSQAEADVAQLNFDPQGRCLVDVTLEPEEIKPIFEASTLNLKICDESDLKTASGRTYSKVTTVSLDCSKSKILKEQFEKKLAEKMGSDTLPKLNESGSVIALQQEFHFHLSLAARLYEKKLPSDNPKKPELITKALKETLRLVNDLVLAKYAQGLKAATDNKGEVDIAKLNEILDKGRIEILPKAHQLFKEQIKEQAKSESMAINFSQLNLKDLKHTAAETTASPNDVIHTDYSQGLVTFIAGSEETAHSRKLGTEFAHRQLITAVLTQDGSVEAIKNPKLQIRTPSPVVKKENYSEVNAQGNKSAWVITEDQFVGDVETKFLHLNKLYNIADKVHDKSQVKTKPIGAFIYNSYTAINQLYNDGGSNKQTQSAHHILKGAHLYNMKQLDNQLAGKDKAVFCLVQNISVSGFGDNLRSSNTFSLASFGNAILNAVVDTLSRVLYPFKYLYRKIKALPEQPFRSRDALVKETTMMAELSMLHTIYDVIPNTSLDRQTIDGIFNEYKEYLRDAQRPDYFYQSDEGTVVRKSIDDLKKSWEGKWKLGGETTIKDIDFITKAKLCIKNMMAANLHYDHAYSKIFQALCVFSEQVSVSGCKSANERTQAINGRVAVLEKALAHSENYKHIHDSINLLALGGNNTKTNADELNRLINAEYNRAGLQGGSSLVSLLDQGGAAKLQKQGMGPTLNTNKAESQDMFNLYQSQSEKMQYHKGVVKYMVKGEKPLNELDAKAKPEPSSVLSKTEIDKSLEKTSSLTQSYSVIIKQSENSPVKSSTSATKPQAEHEAQIVQVNQSVKQRILKSVDMQPEAQEPSSSFTPRL